MRKWMSAVALVLLLGGCAAQGAEEMQIEQTPPISASASAMPSDTPAPTAAPTDTPTPTDTPAPTREPMPVTVEGKALSTSARTLQGKTMLPLLETMERLSYKSRVNELRENDGTRRVHTFTKEGEEIAVSYLLTDNTVSDVSFVRGKLIVPVDRLLLFEDEIVFAPANFFEEAAGVYVTGEDGQIRVSTQMPDLSPEEAPPEGEKSSPDA